MLKFPYQELLIWQKAMNVAEASYASSKHLPETERYGRTSQIRRAGSSIPANIAEGSQRGTNRDFSHFISIARGSLAELETHLLLSKRIGYASEEQISKIFGQTVELSKMLRSFHGTINH